MRTDREKKTKKKNDKAGDDKERRKIIICFVHRHLYFSTFGIVADCYLCVSFMFQIC